MGKRLNYQAIDEAGAINFLLNFLFLFIYNLQAISLFSLNKEETEEEERRRKKKRLQVRMDDVQEKFSSSWMWSSHQWLQCTLSGMHLFNQYYTYIYKLIY